MKKAAQPLDRNGIRTISIAVGPEVDQGEIEKMTPTKKDVIQVDPGDMKPADLAKTIMDKVFTSK